MFAVFDIGGTYFRSSLFDGDKLTGKTWRLFTPNFLNNPRKEVRHLQKLLIEEIIRLVKEYEKEYRGLKAVGVAFPGPITSEGVVTQTNTIWGNKGNNFPLAGVLSRTFPGVVWVLANELTAATERYAQLKKYNNLDYFTVISVGSGIGCKIYDVLNKRVLLDRKSIGGEMGHIKMDFSQEASICDCGGRGHLQALSSGRAVEKMATLVVRDNPDEYKSSCLYRLTNGSGLISNLALVKAIKEGDRFSLRILDKATFPLAYAISHISGNIGADKYIVIGGFALSCGNQYLGSLRRNLLKLELSGRTERDISHLVDFGVNDDNSSLVGIGLLAQKVDIRRVRLLGRKFVVFPWGC